MGVWIETTIGRLHRSPGLSHPVWVCGLKHEARIEHAKEVRSHPVWVCGLKHRKGLLLDVLRRHTLYGCVD